MTLKERLSYYKKVLTGEEIWMPPQIKIRTEWFGSQFAGFYVIPSLLNDSSIVYSFGVGENISFDEELIKRFSCTVFAFDPTPQSIYFIAEKTCPPSFHFYPVGLYKFDGNVDFYLPEDPGYISGSIVNHWKLQQKNRRVSVPVKRFSTIANELHHNKIDVLKMDIEGSEYEAIDDILSSGVEICQLLIEVHHRFGQIKKVQTLELIRKLNCAGYKIAAISANREEYTFVKL